MKVLEYSPSAHRDLREIWRYSDDRWDTEQADTYIHQITGMCEAIANGSRPGTSADYIRPGLWKAVVNVHVVFYREDSNSIVVIRILHQRMDALSHLE